MDTIDWGPIIQVAVITVGAVVAILKLLSSEFVKGLAQQRQRAAHADKLETEAITELRATVAALRQELTAVCAEAENYRETVDRRTRQLEEEVAHLQKANNELVKENARLQGSLDVLLQFFERYIIVRVPDTSLDVEAAPAVSDQAL